MGRIFLGQDQSTPVADFKDKTFGQLVTEANVPELTWKELALFNFGTDRANDVNRILAETIGCKAIDFADPSKTSFDTTRGPTTTGKIYLPKLWTGAENLAPNQTHTITLRKRQPPLAVEITSLPRWFIPGNGPCPVQYNLGGQTAGTSKVDFEVHVTRYFAQDDHGSVTPSGTHGKTPDTTHIIQKRAVLEVDGGQIPSTTQSYDDWRGESEATAGVLEKKGTTYISHACAPYSVMLRFYADTADADAKLLVAPFYPRWKDSNKTLDDTSLVVEWSLSGDNGKLKAGKLIVWDKDDKPVYEIALDAGRLAGKKLDLLNDAPYKVDKTLITKAGMPYRVQIQAHSDALEAKGLAIATMHTAVKGMQYEKAQFVAFNVRPGTKWANGLDGYRGDEKDDDDITARCGLMKSAIQAAAPNVETAEGVLKIFMAPEFFYRGTKGAYVQDNMHKVVEQMRAETDKFEYADWLFVFGSVIGYITHGDNPPTTPTVHAPFAVRGATLTLDTTDGTNTTGTLTFDKEVANYAAATLLSGTRWCVKNTSNVEAQLNSIAIDDEEVDKRTCKAKWTYTAGGPFTTGSVEVHEEAQWVLTADHSGTNSVLEVRAPQCARIPTSVGGEPWLANQNGGMSGKIIRVENLAPTSNPPEHRYRLELEGNGTGIVPGVAFQLSEPTTIEVMNVAYAQKGWPAPEPNDKVLKAAAIYKEYVSQLDFLGRALPDVRHTLYLDPTESKTSGNKLEYNLVPTYGSRGVDGANPSWPSAKTETPRTWDHAGVKHTIGSEVNLTGIGGGSVVTIDGITFGIEVCLDHNWSRLGGYYKDKARPGEPKVQIQLIPSWGASIGLGEICTVKDGLIFNVDGQGGESAARVHDGKWSCDKHPYVTGGGATDCMDTHHTFLGWRCDTCGHFDYNSDPAPQCERCDATAQTRVFECLDCRWTYPLPMQLACPNCSGTKLQDRVSQQKKLQQLGTALVVGSEVEPGLASNWADYLKRKKKVVVYEVAAIPPGETV